MPGVVQGEGGLRQPDGQSGRELPEVRRLRRDEGEGGEPFPLRHLRRGEGGGIRLPSRGTPGKAVLQVQRHLEPDPGVPLLGGQGRRFGHLRRSCREGDRGEELPAQPDRGSAAGGDGGGDPDRGNLGGEEGAGERPCPPEHGGLLLREAVTDHGERLYGEWGASRHGEGERKLSGKIHEKAVLILSNYLGSRYAGRKPISLTASITFEQLYGMIEGDSATCAELYALLSAVSGPPVRQGSRPPASFGFGRTSGPTGGVNEKTE